MSTAMMLKTISIQNLNTTSTGNIDNDNDNDYP